MYKTAKPFFIICETPLHAGSGDSLGIVDLPIQRERHTGFPKIEASSLKGSIRQAFENNKDKQKDISFRKDIHRVFGFDSADLKNDNLKSVIESEFKDSKDKEFSSAIAFTDARLLLFPVKSMKGVFAWITCPEVLSRLKKDWEITGEKSELTIPKENSVPESSSLLISGSSKIVLEEYTFEVSKNADGTTLAEYLADKIYGDSEEHSYWKEKLKRDLVVLSNDDFKDFVNLSTEVITRTKIDNETGTVSPGALFTEEYLPSDSIMYSVVMASPIFCNKKGLTFEDNTSEKVMEFFTSNIPDVMQIGGNYTLGKGIVKISVEKGGK